jgi:ribosomal protein L37AE/L43A
MTGKYSVRHGGLLRCCLESLDKQLSEADVEPAVGTVLTCSFCHNPELVRAADGTWEWNSSGPATSLRPGFFEVANK